MMRLGSVILKVAPRQVADTMWYFPLLQPYVDHVPVKADLSDLEEKIRWCRQNDAKCKEIGENAKAFYQKYVSRDALLDYVEMVCKQISKRYAKPPSWWTPPTSELAPPSLRKPDQKCFEDNKTGNSRLCVRCDEEYTEEERRRKEMEEEIAAKTKSKDSKKKDYRNRMKRIANQKANEAAAKKPKTK
jgi:hypothetical protein